MSQIVSAAPLAILQGIQDLSGTAPVREQLQTPTHMPHVFLYTEKGKEGGQIVNGSDFAKLYGAKSLQKNSKFFNHQSVLAQRLMKRANSMFVERIIPSDIGPKSRLLLSIDLVADEIQQYERDEATGEYILDAAGLPVAIEGETKTGFRARWVLNQWPTEPTAQAFGMVTQRVGSLVSGSSVQSTLYPIFELEAADLGAYGNDLGLRLSVPHGGTSNPMDIGLAETIKAFLFRFQLISRQDASSGAVIAESLSGETALDLCFKPGAYNPRTNAACGIEDVLIQSFESKDQPGLAPVAGPFGRLHVYRNYLNQVLAQIGAAEAPEGLLSTMTVTADSDNLFEINPFTGVNFAGIPYYTLKVEGAVSGGQNFTPSSNLWATGGSDGTLSFDEHDMAVRSICANYPYLDMAIHPQSVIYDTGFKLETKYAIGSVIGQRIDAGVVLSTQDVSQPQNSAADESSMAQSLSAALAMYPESEIFGVPVCRGLVVGHSGYLIDGSYDGLLPLTVDVADKFAAYMGAGNGVWKSGLAPDMPPNNRVTLFRDVNVTMKNASVRNRDWANGLVWVQNYDHQSLFYPAFQTVYNDDSSVLNNALTMFACIELEKIAFRTWRDLTGITSLTNEQFIERSDNIIRDEVANRFDGRFVIRPETFFTAADEQRGFSWSTKIHLYANGMKTVGSFTITANRMSALSESAA